MVPLELDLFLRLTDALYNRELVLGYLQLLVRLGYGVRVFREKDRYRDAVPEVSSGAQKAVDDYLTQRQELLELRVYYLGGLTIEMWMFFKPKEGRILFTVDQEHFNGSDEGRAAFLALVEMFKATYSYWHPFYGYEHWDGEADITQATLLATQKIHHVYRINFLGPELVEKLGQERVLNASAWRKEPLDDGGVLLIPDNTYGSHIPFAMKRLAVALGLQTPQDPDEEWVEDIYDDPAEWETIEKA